MRTVSSEKKVAMPADAKRVNRQMVMNVLRKGTPVTVADIHEETGISRPTAMRTLQHYCELGVAKSLGLGESTNVGGKKPELFCFADERKILCINLWPGQISMGICGLIGKVEKMRVFDKPRTPDKPQESTISAAFGALHDAAVTYVKEIGVTFDDLYGVMLSVPGTVDYDRRMLRYNVKAPEWLPAGL